MKTYIRSNLAVKAEQMDSDFCLKGQQEMFYGKKGDYIVYENGKQRGYAKEDFEQEFIDFDKLDKRTKLILQMYSGYRDPEMHKIYDELESAFAHASLESLYTTEEILK